MTKLSIAVAAACVAGAAFADKVVLKSGSFLTGETGAISGDALKFKSDDLGDMEIKLEKIQSIDKAKNHVVQYVDGTKVERILVVRDGALWSGDAKLDMTKVKAVDPVPESWHGSINIAYNAARGNTYENSAAVIANATRRWEKDRLTADFGYNYADSGKSSSTAEKTSDRWEAELKHDHFWWEKIYHYENGRFDRDEIQDLMWRYRLGVGLGYQWLENRVFESTGKWNFNQEFGVNWIKERYGDGSGKDGGFVALRYAHHFGFNPKFYENVELFHNFEILPEVDDWEKLFVKTDVGLSTKIIMDFDLLAKIEWDYDSQPAADRKKSDLRYIVGLGYKW